MWRYYYLDDHTRTVFYTETELGEDRPDLVFVGMSQNPNPRMAVALFVQKDLSPQGYKIKAL
ncbi:hypothetical protein [Roseovarius Plymouth podovirus 1]|uniref:Uncharacterized protein n=2 Tax=Roseovarius Plymouth podovirus 1 TaxID=926474 RepID=K4Q555_9CAUD|nr:hypothetical protein HYO70_gp18 [Roseovarius Plymouth podovirus 1]CBW47011.1 hypothetical protein [Roseovarius sp. 217 phage 1]CBX87948.1 hypothetical protein [Roseovarius Plymouth podovirus 1]